MKEYIIKPDWERLSKCTDDQTKSIISKLDIETIDFEALNINNFIKTITRENFDALISLFKDYKFQKYQDDLLYIGTSLLADVIFFPMDYTLHKWEKNLIDAKSFIKDNINDFNIVIKHKSLNEEFVITSPILNAQLINYIIKKEVHKDSILNIKEKGRKQKHHHLGHFSHTLQLYLQENTYLKAEKSISVSNQQAIFIYWFLYNLRLTNIPEDSIDYVNYIRMYLNKYREDILKNPKPTEAPSDSYIDFLRKILKK